MRGVVPRRPAGAGRSLTPHSPEEMLSEPARPLVEAIFGKTSVDPPSVFRPEFKCRRYYLIRIHPKSIIQCVHSWFFMGS